MYKSFLGVAALAVAGVAFVVARLADEKADKVTSKFNKASTHILSVCRDDIDNRMTDTIVSNVLKEAAERKADEITKRLSDNVSKTISSTVNDAVGNVLEDELKAIDLTSLIRRKAQTIVEGLSASDISETLIDDIKKSIVKEMKGKVKNQLSDMLFE